MRRWKEKEENTRIGGWEEKRREGIVERHRINIDKRGYGNIAGELKGRLNIGASVWLFLWLMYNTLLMYWCIYKSLSTLRFLEFAAPLQAPPFFSLARALHARSLYVCIWYVFDIYMICIWYMYVIMYMKCIWYDMPGFFFSSICAEIII